MKVIDALKKYRIKKAEIESVLSRIAVYQIALSSNNLHMLGYYTRQTPDMDKHYSKLFNRKHTIENILKIDIRKHKYID